MLNLNSLFKKDPKKYLIDNLIFLFEKSINGCDKKECQRIRLCLKILNKIRTKDYSSKEKIDLDKYLFELNKEKQDKEKDVRLFATILAEYILYGK